MQLTDIPFEMTDWTNAPSTAHAGESGTAYWSTRQYGGIRVRMVTYSEGYRSDHWCTKGHILLCVEGQLHVELKDGREFALTPGMSFQVADDDEPHRASSAGGARLFIVD